MSATVGENAASLQVGRSVRAAPPLDRIYGHEGKRRRYRRLINENYPQDTPSNTFGPAAPPPRHRGRSGSPRAAKEAYRAPILISCRPLRVDCSLPVLTPPPPISPSPPFQPPISPSALSFFSSAPSTGIQPKNLTLFSQMLCSLLFASSFLFVLFFVSRKTISHAHSVYIY